jgi:integrase
MEERGNLSEKKIAKLLGKPGRYSDGHGLYLKVVNENNASWVFRWQRGPIERMMGLGPLHTYGLREARALAKEKRQLLKQGIDPLDEREKKWAASKTITFKEAAENCMTALEPGWKNRKHRDQWRSTLETYAYPKIGGMPVSEIDTPDVLKVLQPIWAEKAETATRVRSRIARVLDWAKAAKLRTGDNAAEWKGNLESLLARPSKVKKVRHHPALPHRDIPAFMAELRDREGTAAAALQFTIMTAARTNEVIDAVWSEIDFEAKTWVIPPEQGRRPLQHGYGEGAGADEPRRNHRSRFPIHLYGLGTRQHSLPESRDRYGAGACDRRQGRGELSARRSIREASAADG